MAVADLNSDGRTDLVVANSYNNISDGTVSVLLGNGDGTFQPQQTYATGSEPISVAVADLNGDGMPDIVTANAGDNTVSVLMGNGDGTFQPQATFTPCRLEPISVAVADVNGDGIPDIITADYETGQVSVLLGDGHGNFSSPQLYQVGAYPRSVAVADLGNGTFDIITANSGGSGGSTVSVLLGDGHGGFHYLNDDSAAGTFAIDKGPHVVLVDDVTKDGKPDIITQNTSGTISVLLGNGNGTFQPEKSIPVGFTPQGLAVADVNGDGIPDLVSADFRTASVDVLLGNGNGTFTPTTPANAVEMQNTPYLADLNGDGIPD